MISSEEPMAEETPGEVGRLWCCSLLRSNVFELPVWEESKKFNLFMNYSATANNILGVEQNSKL